MELTGEGLTIILFLATYSIALIKCFSAWNTKIAVLEGRVAAQDSLHNKYEVETSKAFDKLSQQIEDMRKDVKADYKLIIQHQEKSNKRVDNLAQAVVILETKVER